MANNAEKLRTKLHRELPFAHPIKEHPIDKCEEFVKKLYIDMLCVIAQYENSDTEFSLNFVQRIMAGAEMKEPVTEHVKNAMEITEERFGEFLRQCRENKLENIFVVDAMLIACADGKPNSKQGAMLAELTAALGFKKKQVEILSSLAAVILEQNSDKYFEVYKTIPKNDVYTVITNVVCYITEFVSGVLIDCSELLLVYSKNKTKLNDLSLDLLISESPFEELFAEIAGEKYSAVISEDYPIRHHQKVVFENLIINERIRIEYGDSVTFKNCEMYSADVFNYRYLNIVDCIFDGKNDSTNFYHISNNTRITITSSIFKNYSSWKKRMGRRLFLVEDDFYEFAEPCSVSIKNCRFENIESSEYTNAFSVHNSGVSIEDSIFIKCTGKFLFTDWEKLKNNTFTNCCPLTGLY